MNENLRIGILGLRGKKTQKRERNGKRWEKGTEAIT